MGSYVVLRVETKFHSSKMILCWNGHVLENIIITHVIKPMVRNALIGVKSWLLPKHREGSVISKLDSAEVSPR